MTDREFYAKLVFGAAVSQLNYIIEHNTDETVVAAAREAIRATRQ